MIRELLSNFQMVVLPSAALILFLVVFVSVIVQAAARQKSEVDSLARLPLAEEESR